MSCPMLCWGHSQPCPWQTHQPATNQSNQFTLKTQVTLKRVYRHTYFLVWCVWSDEVHLRLQNVAKRSVLCNQSNQTCKGAQSITWVAPWAFRWTTPWAGLHPPVIPPIVIEEDSIWHRFHTFLSGARKLIFLALVRNWTLLLREITTTVSVISYPSSQISIAIDLL